MRVENHIHIRHIMLYHYEKVWGRQHSHFAISTNFLANEQSAKAKLKNGSRSSNRVIQTSKMKKEEVDHQISTIRLLASVEEDKILTTRMLTKDFNVDN